MITVLGRSPCQTSNIELLAKVGNGRSPCQTSKLEHFVKIVTRLNPCQKSKIELIRKQSTNEIHLKHLRWRFLQKLLTD